MPLGYAAAEAITGSTTAATFATFAMLAVAAGLIIVGAYQTAECTGDMIKRNVQHANTVDVMDDLNGLLDGADAQRRRVAEQMMGLS